jgi:hypothetical protein
VTDSRGGDLRKTQAHLTSPFLFSGHASSTASPLQRFAQALLDKSLQDLSRPSIVESDSTESFPCLLPYPEVELTPIDRPSSGRKRTKLAEHTAAKRIVNRAVALFSFWESGCPSKQAMLKASIAAAVVPHSVSHKLFFDNMYRQALSFARLSKHESLNRGARSLAQRIEYLQHNAYHGIKSCDVEKLASSAMMVDPDRIAVPKRAAQCNPKDILTGRKLEQFNSMLHDILVRPIGPVPKPCHKVDAADVYRLHCKLLDSGMCILVPG